MQLMHANSKMNLDYKQAVRLNSWFLHPWRNCTK